MIVKLPTELTLSYVAETRAAFCKALQSHEPIEIDGQDVTEVDVAGLQLLCSLHRGALSQGTAIVFTGGQRGNCIQQARTTAGFARHVGCVPGCLWQEPEHG